MSPSETALGQKGRGFRLTFSLPLHVQAGAPYPLTDRLPATSLGRLGLSAASAGTPCRPDQCPLLPAAQPEDLVRGAEEGIPPLSAPAPAEPSLARGSKAIRPQAGAMGAAGPSLAARPKAAPPALFQSYPRGGGLTSPGSAAGHAPTWAPGMSLPLGINPMWLMQGLLGTEQLRARLPATHAPLEPSSQHVAERHGPAPMVRPIPGVLLAIVHAQAIGLSIPSPAS